MKRGLGLGLALLLAGSGAALAVEREGLLVDVEFMSDVPLHLHSHPDVAEKVSQMSGEEMLRRAGRRAEFGVLIDGRFLFLDRAGNEMARDIVSRSMLGTGFRVRVDGSFLGDRLEVDAMDEY